MFEETMQVQKLKKEIPDIEETLKLRPFSQESVSKLEYFTSRVVALAEMTKNLNSSTIIKRISDLQRDKAYPMNMHIIISNAKGLLDSLDMCWKD